MRWGVRAAGSGRRSTWSVTATASSWRSTSRPGRRTRARRSSRRWPGDCSTAAVARPLAGPLGGGQGLQLSGHPPLVSQAADRGGHPDAQGPAARRALRQGEVSAAEHHRASGRLVQGVSPLGTRHEKLAVNYVALWLVAMIDRVLKLCFRIRPNVYVRPIFKQTLRAPACTARSVRSGSRACSACRWTGDPSPP